MHVMLITVAFVNIFDTSLPIAKNISEENKNYATYALRRRRDLSLRQETFFHSETTQASYRSK